MTKTRNLSDLLDANGDVKLGNLDNVPASNDASALTTGTLPIARIADGDIALAKLSATGTKDATTFLRGDNTFAAAGGGKVLQVLTATDSTERTTSSASYVTASSTLSIAITPAATSSKIYVMADFTGKTTNTGRIFYTLFRDSTNIGTTSGLNILENFSGGVMAVPVNLAILDSPSTTSATTYTVQMRVENAAGAMNYLSTLGSITVMEIGA